MLTSTENGTVTPFPGNCYANGVRLPKYCLHKASGRAYIKYKPLWGKKARYLKGKYHSQESRLDYARCCQRIIKHKMGVAKPPRSTTKRLTVRAFVARFMAEMLEHFGNDPTNRDYGNFRRAARVFRLRYGVKPLSSIGPVRLKRVRRDMIKKDWSRKYVNKQFTKLRRMFAWGVENELVKPGQYALVKLVAGLRKGHTTATERPPVERVEWSVASQVLPFLGPVTAAMVEVQHLTGMRSAELTAMSIAEIEFRADVWLYRPTRHKTEHWGKSKTICLGPRAQEILIPYLQAGRDEFIFSPRVAMLAHWRARSLASKCKRYGKRKNPRHNLSKYRERYFTDSYRQSLHYGFDKLEKHRRTLEPNATVERWHPHRLRHDRATLTRELYKLEGAQVQLGNTKEATEIYAEKSLPLAMQIARETG